MTVCAQCEQALNSRRGFWNPEEQPVSAARLADGVRQASLERPEKVYEAPLGEGCKYTDRTGEEAFTPGCIVGTAIFALTGRMVDQSALPGAVNNAAWREALGATAGTACAGTEFRDQHPAMTRYLFSWLRAVQEAQDDGAPWGAAVASADRVTAFADSEH